jgi:hypothetical protein
MLVWVMGVVVGILVVVIVVVVVSVVVVVVMVVMVAVVVSVVVVGVVVVVVLVSVVVVVLELVLEVVMVAVQGCGVLLCYTECFLSYLLPLCFRSPGLVCCSGWGQLGNECLTRMYTYQHQYIVFPYLFRFTFVMYQ